MKLRSNVLKQQKNSDYNTKDSDNVAQNMSSQLHIDKNGSQKKQLYITVPNISLLVRENHTTR